MNDADASPVLFTKDDEGVAVLTLNRPDRLNAYTPELCAGIVTAVDTYLRDDALRALIITGAGRGFCAGGDIKGDTPEFLENRAMQLGEAKSLRQDMHAVCRAIAGVDKPIIAAINGVAISGGLTLALMCDVRLAGTSARLGDTSGRAGMIPDEGGAWAFPRAMGYDRAWLMVATQELLTAQDAVACGLVTRVVPDEALMDEAIALARRISQGAPIAQRMAKRLMRAGANQSLSDALDAAGIAAEIVIHTDDATEGKAAFREKRAPRFTGR
ncbi:enoyl-CoA hydratase/isomerase family protein [Aeromicrobium wangtongii]|uniref:Enoyl-CoA hydratase-related protein n=1 Tax=Aeromicrobium wangtongii TaxID=2969247 RepID=A0ABY5MBF0_9ACTN|nr:enoyl-CoA hydratase-related protein [Aeromicrobium wangtongii]MCD9196964.1 enoyl-CoA hydratase-related protein [Aeromicrobium wangtongii]UUP14469.1 enoyl-CoA hydratase-related protein [Aeromicrobium wangtongii]